MRQPFGCLFADGIAHQRGPAQQQPFQPQRLMRPAPQIKRVDVANDLAIAKLKSSVDFVDHGAAGLRKGVVGYPVGLALLIVAPFIGLYPIFMMKALCFAIFAVAFNLLLGFTGLLSLLMNPLIKACYRFLNALL